VVIVKDFTLLVYKNLLQTLKYKDYEFLTVEEYFNHSVTQSLSRLVILMRHDVDRKPQNFLRMAKLEAGFGIKLS
jgi:predicted transcriptional regulator